MTGKVLIISDWPPFPPKNGMHLPIAKHSEHLRNGGVRFDLLLLTYQNAKQEDSSSAFFDQIFYFPLPSKSLSKRLLSEVSINEPFYWDLDMSGSQVDTAGYDAVWVSNARLAPTVYHINRNRNCKVVLTSNDCIYFFYYERVLAALKGRERFSLMNLANILRLPFIMLNERKYLRYFDAVHVQTYKERERMLLLNRRFCEKIFIAPNGINEDLFNVQPDLNSKNILLMNHMTDGRERQALWFLKHVWRRIVKQNPQLKLLVVGTLPDQRTMESFGNFPNVEFLGYVRNLEDIYKTVSISVIPHFQSSGYINRLYDAMCAGVPVVISHKIASTTQGFKNGIHGIISSSKTGLCKSILELSSNYDLKCKFALEARSFMTGKNTWEKSAEIMNSMLIDG